MEKVQIKPNWANIPEGETGIDIECVALCEVMNKFPGIETNNSCCGHGEKPFRIYFHVSDLKDLPSLLYWFDGCHTFYGWKVSVHTDCGMSPVYFVVEGPIGEMAYVQANRIAAKMQTWLDEKIIERYGRSL